MGEGLQELMDGVRRLVQDRDLLLVWEVFAAVPDAWKRAERRQDVRQVRDLLVEEQGARWKGLSLLVVRY